MYRWDPQDYHASSAPQQAWAEELIGKLGLQGAERVLDLGCGDGKVTAAIARRVPRGSVVGIDSSPEMIAFARTSFPGDQYGNLRFAVMDMRELAFDGEFDVVYSSAALHWVREQERVLAGIRRALRPSGRALLQMGGRGNAAHILAVLDHMVAEPAWREYFVNFPFPYTFPDTAEYRTLLGNTALHPRRVDIIPKEMVHRTREDCAAWIRTTWLPYLERLPEGLRERFIDEVIGHYIRLHPPDSDGCIRVEMRRLEVDAERR